MRIVLVAMNAAALKNSVQKLQTTRNCHYRHRFFSSRDLKKADFTTDDYLKEMGIDPDRVVALSYYKDVKDCLADTGMDNKAMLKCRNMFALGLVLLVIQPRP